MKKLLLALSSLAIAPSIAIAQTPAPSDMGDFLAQEMCAQYLETGVIIPESGYGKLAGKVMATYGPESGLLLLELASKFSEPPEKIVNDPYIFPMAQSLFTSVVGNDDCFRAFLEGEIFGKDKEESPTAEVAEPVSITEPLTTPEG